MDTEDQELGAYESVSDEVVLAAIDRAVRHGAEDAWIATVCEHLGFQRTRHNTRRVRQQLEQLRVGNGWADSQERHGREYWRLTRKGAQHRRPGDRPEFAAIAGPEDLHRRVGRDLAAVREGPAKEVVVLDRVVGVHVREEQRPQAGDHFAVDLLASGEPRLAVLVEGALADVDHVDVTGDDHRGGDSEALAARPPDRAAGRPQQDQAGPAPSRVGPQAPLVMPVPSTAESSARKAEPGEARDRRRAGSSPQQRASREPLLLGLTIGKFDCLADDVAHFVPPYLVIPISIIFIMAICL